MSLSRRLRRHFEGADRERGETLIEILASVALMGIAVLTILGALYTVLAATDVNKMSARMDTNLHKLAETVQARTGDFQYRRCGGGPGRPDNGPSITYPALTDVPAGWTAEITRIRYWDGVASRGTIGDPNHSQSYNFNPALGHTRLNFVNSCPFNRIPASGTPVIYPRGRYDFGLQEITIRLTSPPEPGGRGQITDSIVVIKRDPMCADGTLTC